MNAIKEMLCAAVIVVLLTLCTVFYCELGSTRRELEQARVELAAAQSRQSDIREIVERTGTVLSESINSVADIRRQIAEIRSNYEEMENLLCSSGSN